MKNKFAQYILFVVFVFSSQQVVFAQEDGNDNILFFKSNTSSSTDPGGHDPSGDPAPASPIDSSIIILFTAAIGIGVIYKNKMVKYVK